MSECCHEDGALLAARRSIRHPTASLVPASHPDRSTRPVPNDGTQHEAEAPLGARRTWRGFDLSDFEAATGVRSLDPRPLPRARDHLVGARLARVRSQLVGAAAYFRRSSRPVLVTEDG